MPALAGTIPLHVAAPAHAACCVAVAEFSIDVHEDTRGQGTGVILLGALIEAAEGAGLWKPVSRISPENRASLALCARIGFRAVGTNETHAKLDGVWRDVVVERLIPANLS